MLNYNVLLIDVEYERLMIGVILFAMLGSGLVYWLAKRIKRRIKKFFLTKTAATVQAKKNPQKNITLIVTEKQDVVNSIEAPIC